MVIFLPTFTQIQTKGWFKDEISKVALLTLLYDIFLFDKRRKSKCCFHKETVFYNQMNPQGFNLFKNLTQRFSRLTLEKNS
jgi:hypothetical protein